MLPASRIIFRRSLSASRAAALLCLLLLAFSAVPAFGREKAEPVSLQETDNFYRVTPFLYRSAQPSAKAMKQYKAFGIKTVINLRANHSDDEEAEGTGLILRRVPINTWDISVEQAAEVLALIRTSETPVLLHCRHGADRTGLMIALFRIIEQGWSKEDALDELQNGGFGYHSIWTNIPEFIEKTDMEALRRAVDAKDPAKAAAN